MSGPSSSPSFSERERWDARHGAVGAGVPAPPDALRGRVDLLPSGGRALDLACGRGTVTVWLAGLGFTVDAADISPVGLASAAALAAEHGVADRVRRHECDLGDGLPVPGPFDVLVAQRFRDPALYPAMLDALAPGGLLVVTVLSEVGDTGGRFRAAPGELRAAFGGLEIVVDDERDGGATLVARRPSAVPPAP